MALVLLPCTAWGQSTPQPFGACPIEAYQTIQVGGSYGLYTINVGDGTLVLQGTDTNLQGNNTGNTNGINAIGFNEADRFIYGWNIAARQIIRIGQNGVAASIGATPAGTPTGNAVVGDIKGGSLYLLFGSTIRVFNLTTNTLTSTVTINGPTGYSDWAFNALDGQLYGVTAAGQVIRTDPTSGAAAIVSGITVPSTSTAFGAVYFDSQGSLYASRNDGTIFRIRNLTGGGTPSVQVLTTAAPATGQNDGARCPNSAPPVASIAVRKQLTAESGTQAGRAEANELLTYTFTLTNSGLAASGATYGFFEVLPVNTALVSVTGGSIDCPVGAVGSRLCTITVSGSIPGSGGTRSATMVVRVANPIPAGTTQILNLATDDDSTPPAGCSTTNQLCATPPVCTAASDPNHCVALPLPAADLRISKTNTPASGPDDQANDNVVTGTQTTYTLVVTNLGPDAASGAVVKDTPGASLTCPATNPVTCTGAACPVGAITVGTLQTGVTLGNLTATAGSNAVTLSLSCTVL